MTGIPESWTRTGLRRWKKGGQKPPEYAPTQTQHHFSRSLGSHNTKTKKSCSKKEGKKTKNLWTM
jgi:hypothetical protein